MTLCKQIHPTMGITAIIVANQINCTDVGQNIHVVSAHDIDREASTSLREGTTIDHLSIEDQSGRYFMKGPLVVFKTQYHTYTGKHAIFQLIAPNGISSEVPNTWNNYPDKHHVDVQYLSAAQSIMYEGAHSGNRTDMPTTKKFGHMMKFDMRDGYPLVTSKYVAFNGVMKELAWLCRGETNINTLGCKIWDEWATPEGELGPVYGAMWRGWEDTRIVNDSDPKMLDFLLGQNYELAATFANSDAMDEELRKMIKETELTVEDFQTYLEQNGIRTLLITADENRDRETENDSVQLFFNDQVLHVFEYSVNIEGYYRVLNAMGIDGKWDTSSYVYTKKFDQLNTILDSLKNNPNDRRMLVTSLNPGLTPVAKHTMSVWERKENWINTQMQEQCFDVETWMAEANRRLNAGGEDPLLQAREYVESQLYNSGPSDIEDLGPMTEDQELVVLLDYVDAPTTLPLTPSDNAAYGQQALPPCHMMFQVGTSPMSHSDRYDEWARRRTQQLMNDADFLREEGLTDYSPTDTFLSIKIKDKLAGEAYRKGNWKNKAEELEEMAKFFDSENVPTHFIDMTMYQRKQHCALAA